MTTVKQQNRFFGFFFFVFALTIIPPLLGPPQFTDRAWMHGIDWPVYAVHGRMWVPVFVVTHTLLAIGVAVDGIRNNNKITIVIWALQFVSITSFVVVFFHMQSLPTSAIILLITMFLGVLQLWISRYKLYTSIYFVPFSLFYAFAAFTMFQVL